MKNFAKTKLSLGPVAENRPHEFAMRHAFAVYESHAIFTFVPKNASTTMRYSIARNNRFIDETTDVDWHHSNNLTFCASQEFAVTADYAFVILRCPFRRLASAFLDKVVTANNVVRSLYPAKLRKIQLRIMERMMYHGLSFRDFVERIARLAFTIGYEVAEQLGWRAPDHIVAPMASGSIVTRSTTSLKSKPARNRSTDA